MPRPNRIMTVTREVRTLCQIIANEIDRTGNKKGDSSRGEDARYRITFKVPGDGYHSTTLAGHQAEAIADGDDTVIDYGAKGDHNHPSATYETTE